MVLLFINMNFTRLCFEDQNIATKVSFGSFSIIVLIKWTILSELCSKYYMQNKKYSTPTPSRSLCVELEIRTRFGINIQVMAKKEKMSHACGKAKYQCVCA